MKKTIAFGIMYFASWIGDYWRELLLFAGLIFVILAYMSLL